MEMLFIKILVQEVTVLPQIVPWVFISSQQLLPWVFISSQQLLPWSLNETGDYMKVAFSIWSSESIFWGNEF